MAVQWPSSLPNPQSSGYSVNRGDGRVVTEMHQGPRRKRKRFVNLPSQINLTFKMSMEELALFDDFWTIDLDGGMNDMSIQIVEKGGFATKNVQIISLGETVPIGGELYQFSMQVETV